MSAYSHGSHWNRTLQETDDVSQRSIQTEVRFPQGNGDTISDDAHFAKILYDIATEDGGVGSSSENFIDTKALHIKPEHLKRFASKCRLLQETMSFVAANTGMALTTASSGSQTFPKSRLPKELAKLIHVEWKKRGIVVDSYREVAEEAFKETDLLLTKPFAWGADWLQEFAEDQSDRHERYITWAGQCLTQFRTTRGARQSCRTGLRLADPQLG